MSLIGVIPARGGSKGIPRKNLADCGGRPLIACTFAAALGSSALDRVILSTDDEEIAATGRTAGVEVPFLRPPELAADDTPMIAVLTHLLAWLGDDVEALVLLQPTSPLRTSAHIDAAVELFRRSGADTVVSVTEVPHRFTPGSLLKLEGELLVPLTGTPVLRRQDKPTLFARNGPAILIVRPEVVRSGKFYAGRTAGYGMDMRSSIDIDGPEDLALLRALLAAPPASS